MLSLSAWIIHSWYLVNVKAVSSSRFLRFSQLRDYFMSAGESGVIIIAVVPVKTLNQLLITWPLPSQVKHYRYVSLVSAVVAPFLNGVTGHPLPWWFTQLLVYVETSAVSQCSEQHSRSTQRSSSVVSPTAHTVWTPSSVSFQDSRHWRSLLSNVWLEKCRETAPSVWTQRRSRDF